MFSIAIFFQLVAAVSGWLKLAMDITWMWIALSVIRATYNPPGRYWVIVNRVMQVGPPTFHLHISLTRTFRHTARHSSLRESYY